MLAPTQVVPEVVAVEEAVVVAAEEVVAAVLPWALPSEQLPALIDKVLRPQ